MTSQDEIMKSKIHGGNKQDNQVPEEYASDPDLYWAIQASLNQDTQADENNAEQASHMQNQMA